MVNGWSASLVFALNFAAQGPDFVEGDFGFSMRWWFAMPMKIVFHEIYTLTRYGPGQNHHRLIHNCFGHMVGFNNCLNIIAVNFHDVPAKGFPFSVQVLQRHNCFGGAINLDVVTISDSNKVT